MEHLIKLILVELDKKPHNIAKKKFGTTPEITYYDLLSAILHTNTSSEAASTFGLTQKPINAAMKKLLPTIKLAGGGDTWKHTLLCLIKHKNCNGCDTIKPNSDFTSTASKCKACISRRNTSELGKQYNRDYYKQHYATNAKYYLYKTEKRRSRTVLATPSWVNHYDIANFYINCPEGYHVDHIVPLQGKYVCGLHILSNLQYLSAIDNLKKGNYHESEEYWK
jgi:hypothetical protein